MRLLIALAIIVATAPLRVVGHYTRPEGWTAAEKVLGYDGGQRRVAKTTVAGVNVYEPASEIEQAPLAATATAEDLVTEVVRFGADGRALEVKLPDGRTITTHTENAASATAGTRVKSIVESGETSRRTDIVYDAGAGAANNPLRVARTNGGEPADADYRAAETASRKRSEVVVEQSDDFTHTNSYDEFGQLERESRKTSSGQLVADLAEYEYYDSSAAPIARGRLKSVIRPDGAALLRYTYAALGAGDRIVMSDDVRGTTTTIDRDALGRPIRKVVSHAGETLADETYGYDANGRPVYAARQQREVGLVVTRTRYDDMLRPVEQSITDAAVDGVAKTVKTRTTYDLAERTVTSDPFIESPDETASEITTLDPLGRVVETKRISPDGAQTRAMFAYGRQGQSTFESDGVRSAVVRGFDAFGRETFSVDSMMQRAENSWTAWGEPESQKRLDASGILQGGTPQLVAHQKRKFTRDGKVRSLTEELGGGKFRQTRFAWENGGLRTRTYVGEVTSIDEPIRGASRVVEQEMDAAGRVIANRVGIGNGLPGEFAANGIFSETRTEPGEFDGMLPAAVHASEPLVEATFTTRTEYDGLGRPRLITAPGGYTIERTYDEAGNVLTGKTTGHELQSAMRYDSRGLATQQIHAAPGAPSIRYRYDARGALTEYIDERDQRTHYELDGLGRTVRTLYPDQTCEQTIYEQSSGVVSATRDRAGQWLVYRYIGYLLEEVRLGPVGPASECAAPALNTPPSASRVFVAYRYDLANRLTRIATEENATEFDHFDLAGRPGTTRSIRYRNRTGLTTHEVLDVHTQPHVWSLYDGERDRYRMPAAGSIAPANATSSAWRSWIEEKRDGVGNLTAQNAIAEDAANAVGTPISGSSMRGLGRIATRTRAQVATLYGYAEPKVIGNPDAPSASTAPGPYSGLLGRAEVSVGGVVIGGSEITRDVTRRIAHSTALGWGGRASQFEYDDRDRLTHSVLGALPDSTFPPVVVDVPDEADFRRSRTVRRLTDAERAALGDRAAELELPSFTAEPGAAHQIATLDFNGDLSGDVAFAFKGGRRISDGRWTAAYDPLGRLVRLTRAAAVTGEPRRYEYEYNAANRLVGRRACSNAGDEPCVPHHGGSDGLPAETTFVWDPIVDRLLAIYETGRSTGTEGEYAGLLRQYVHGSQGYDDPVEILAAATPTAPPARYLPLFDEAGTGNLTAVLRADGTLAERVLYGDAWGAQPRYLHGPAVDRVTIERTSPQQTRITVHVSDAIAPATVATGAILRSTRANGSLAATSSVVPELDPTRHTLTWTLGETDWTHLTSSDATHLEVALTTALRTPAWGTTPVIPPPQWQLDRGTARTATAEPVIVRQAIGDVGGARTLYAISDLYLAASATSVMKLLTGFKAAPFVEPGTGFVNLRNRWYDPATGSWLTPDARSYSAGSSNLYGGFNSDPVNNGDPDGNEPVSLAAYAGWAALNTAVDTGIDYAFHRWLGEGDFEWGKSFGTNFAVNLATGGIGGKLAKGRYLKHLLEYGADVAITGTIEKYAYGQSNAEAYGSAAVGGVLGRGASYGLQRGARWLRDVASFDIDLHLNANDEAAMVDELGGQWTQDPTEWVDEYVYSFMGKNGPIYYDRPDATFGAPGGTVWVTPIADAVHVRNRSNAATQTGYAPGVLQSYLKGEEIFGVVVPREGLSLRTARATDAGTNKHWRPGALTGIQDVNGVWHANPTREFVLPGGAPMPPGSVFFRMNVDGSWTPIRRY